MTTARWYVRFYKVENNGEVMVETNHTDPDRFMDDCAGALLRALAGTEGDEEYTLTYALPAIVNIVCKLRGYKVETVIEQRALLAGSYWPAPFDLIATTDSPAPEMVGTLPEKPV